LEFLHEPKEKKLEKSFKKRYLFFFIFRFFARAIKKKQTFNFKNTFFICLFENFSAEKVGVSTTTKKEINK